MTEQEFFTRQQCAAYLGISLRHFDRHVARDLPRVQIGTLVRYAKRDLDVWIEEHRVSPLPEEPARPPSPPAMELDAKGRAILERLRRGPRQ